MLTLDPEQTAARHWFESLRDRICAEFEAIEREAGSDARFDYIAWDRADLRVMIPMQSGFRSLNVAVSAAIALGEALRQTGGWPRNGGTG